MVTSASKTFSNVNEVYDFLDDIDAEDYRITGSMILGRHPEVERRMVRGEPLEMDLDEVYRELDMTPRTNYKVSVSYGDGSKVSVTARVGPLPSMTIKGELSEFDNFEQYQQFLEEGQDWR